MEIKDLKFHKKLKIKFPHHFPIYKGQNDTAARPESKDIRNLVQQGVLFLWHWMRHNGPNCCTIKANCERFSLVFRFGKLHKVSRQIGRPLGPIIYHAEGDNMIFVPLKYKFAIFLALGRLAGTRATFADSLNTCILWSIIVFCYTTVHQTVTKIQCTT